MNNYNYNFPNSGTNNWGHGLNAILKQMQTDISALQNTVYAGIDQSVESLTFPYASSGIVGNSTSFEVKINGNEINVNIINGVFYFGGIKRILRTLTNFQLNTKGLNDQYYYLYLKYDPVDDNVVLEQNSSLLTEWSYILLGVTTPYGEFVTKVYSATKTAMQHQDEDTKRSVEIIVDTITASENGMYFGSISGTTNATVTYYGDGVGYTVNSTENDSKTFTLIAGNHEFTESFIDYYDTGILQTERIKTGTTLSKTNVFRVLMTIDGRLYRQYYHLDHPELTYDLSSENTIKNFGFFNHVKPSSGSGYLQASGYVEICRVLKDKNGQFYVFKSENNGLWGLPNASLWHGYTGQIATPSLKFTGGTDGSYPFQFSTQQSNKTYVLPKASSRAASIIDSQTGYQEIDLITNAYAGDKSIVWDLQDSQTMNTRISRASGGYSSFVMSNAGASLGILDSNNNTLQHGIAFDESQVEIKTTNSQLTMSDNMMNWNGLIFNRSNSGFSLSPIISDYELMDFTKFTSLKTSHISVEQGYDLTFVSDRRHKENINTLYNNSLMIVKNTPVVTYNYIGSDAPQIGIISQDLEQSLNDYENKCFIQVVKEDTIPDCKRLKETKLIYILWKALQEETAKREELEVKISKLLGE